MHGPGTDCTAEDLASRSSLAQWLSGILAGEIDPARSSPPTGRWPARLAKALRALKTPSAATGRLESERVRLFVNAPGGIPAPPYGSWWVERRVQGDLTTQVADYYRSEGLRAETGSGAADYLPTELEFIHFLLQHQRAGRLTGESRLERQAALREREFLDRYVHPWLGDFGSAVAAAARDPYWPALVDAIAVFVTDESSRVEAARRPPAP